MSKKRVIIIIIGLAVIVGGCIVAWYIFRPNSSKENTPELKTSPTIETSKQVSDLDSIIVAFDKKDHEKVLSLYKDYEKDNSSHPTILTASMMCLESAITLSRNDEREACYQKARSVALSSEDEQVKTLTVKTIDALYKGEQIQPTEGVSFE